jgi:Tol biopolymer transport system component
MNLKPDGENLRFVQFKYDGSDFKVLSEKRLGSGHPSITPDGKWIVSDAYNGEPVSRALGNGQVPIRLFNVHDDTEENICSVYTFGNSSGTLRCDPHPAWSPDYKKVAFNGAPNEARQVFVAELSGIV